MWRPHCLIGDNDVKVLVLSGFGERVGDIEMAL